MGGDLSASEANDGSSAEAETSHAGRISVGAGVRVDAAPACRPGMSACYIKLLTMRNLQIDAVW